MEVESVSRMIKGNNYHDFDFKPDGAGIQHIYILSNRDVVENKQQIYFGKKAANKYFVGNRQLLWKLEVLESALENNAKQSFQQVLV